MPQLEGKPFGPVGRVEILCCWWITSKAASDEWGSLYGKLAQKRQMNVNHSAVGVLAENLFDNIPMGVQAGWRGGQCSLEFLPLAFNIMNTNQYWFSCMFCWLPVVKKNCCWRRMDFEWIKCLFSERRTGVLSRTWQLRFRCQPSRPFTYNFTLDRECLRCECR